MNEIGNYAISLSGTDLNGNKFQLDTIEFKVRSKAEVTITDKRLIDIGKTAIAGKMNYDTKRKILVERNDGEYIVTFPNPPLPPGSRGGDYAAKVFIDRGSLQVKKIWVSP
ncbi:MAG: hypothetical protein AB7F32_04100 [Victivallaceae bacterium]